LKFAYINGFGKNIHYTRLPSLNGNKLAVAE